MTFSAMSSVWPHFETAPPLQNLAILELKIIVFKSGVGHCIFEPIHAGIHHVMVGQFGAEIPTKKKCPHPLHFELKLTDFRGGVCVRFLAICMTHTTATIPCLNLYNKCNRVLLFGGTLFPKLRGGPYPLFQTRVKKVGSVYWCRIQISYCQGKGIFAPLLYHRVSQSLIWTSINLGEEGQKHHLFTRTPS